MDSIPNEFPISLQSWPIKEKDPNAALPELIRRINIERGGFRDLSEDGLRQEIAEAEAGAGEDASSDEEEEEKPDRLKELVTARDEMLQQLEQAHQSALFALDFVSLLLSKDQPNQGGSTLSPFLRETVGMGTLGADKLAKPQTQDPKEAAKIKDSQAVAKGWKILNLNKSVDSILASATRLEKEIEVETKYWEQVLAISDKGWSICRLPQERHTLGVRFGFSEAATEFKQRSLAALRREKDGSVSLDEGIGSLEPQALRVCIRSQNEETGSSPIPSPIPDDAPIESLILQARNTTFFSELWQELNREARSLSSFGVRSKENTITCPLTGTKTIIIDLAPLSSSSPTATSTDNQIATGISLTLQLLLKEEPVEENGMKDTAESPKEAPAKRGRGKKAIKEEPEDTPMTDAAPAKKTRGKKAIKEEFSEDTPMLDAPEPTPEERQDLKDDEAQVTKTEDAMRPVLGEQDIDNVKAESELAEKRGDPLPKTLNSEEAENMQTEENEENVAPRKLSKGKKAAAPPRKGIDRRALSRGKTEA